jgi:transketolase N-terminal domain/subunit
MKDEEKKELSKSINALADKIDSLGWAVANLSGAIKELLEQLRRKK